jgi:hypothetical protein
VINVGAASWGHITLKGAQGSNPYLIIIEAMANFFAVIPNEVKGNDSSVP